MSSRRSVLPTRVDVVLIALGLVGLSVYLMLTPRIDPASRTGIELYDADALQAKARAFAERSGATAIPDTIPDVFPSQSNSELRRLVSRFGRSESAIRAGADSSAVFGVTTEWPSDREDFALQVRTTRSGQVVSYHAPPSVRTIPGAPVAPPVPGEELFADPAVDDSDRGWLVFHLRGTIYLPQDLALDSLTHEGPITSAHLSEGDDDEARNGIIVRFDGPSLHRIERVTAPSRDNERRSLVLAIRLGVAALLLLLLAVMLVRRFGARQVDAGGAARDAMWAFLTAAVWFGLETIEQYQDEGIPIAFWCINVLITAALGGVFGYVTGATAESVGRPAWPARYRPLALLRSGAYGAARLGRSVLRGTLAGLGMAGLVVGLLAMLPQDISVVLFSEEPDWTLAGFGILNVAFSSLLAILIVNGFAMAVGGWVDARMPTAVAAVAVAIGISVILPTPMLSAMGWELALLGVVAVVMMALFMATDAVVLLVALIVGASLWQLRHVVFLDVQPLALGVLLALVGGLIVYGVVTMLRGRLTGEKQPYEPPYVAELAREARMTRELEIAQTVQATLLPATMPTVAGAQLSGLCIPASEVGGDYYDAFEVDGGRIAFVIGDVSGKGFQAAFYMTLVKGFARAVAQDARTPADALRRMNALFWANVPRGIFVTMIYAVYDPATRRCTFARAGHNPALLRRADGTTQVLRPPGLGLGLQPAIGFDPRIVDEPLSLHPGDTLVLYTDGFSEAMTKDRVIYTDARLAHVLSTTEPTSADYVRDALLAGAEQHDDMTLVVLSIS